MKTNSEQRHPRRFLTRTGETRAFMVPPRLDHSVHERIVGMAVAEGAYGSDDVDRPRGTSKRWRLIDELGAVASIAADIALASPRHREEAAAIVASVHEVLTLTQRGVGGGR